MEVFIKKVVFLDADDSIFDYTQAEEFALKHAMLAAGHYYDADEHLQLYREINKNLWNKFEKGEITSKELRKRRFVKFSTETGHEFDPEEFSGSYLYFLSQSTYEIEDAYELLKYLSEKYEIVIITNGLAEVQRARFEKSRLSKFFNHVIISDEVKCKKPDPRIFKIAMEKSSTNEKSEIMMIGDSLTSDILGGNNFGIETCHFNTQNQDYTDITPTYSVKKLLDIKGIL